MNNKEQSVSADVRYKYKVLRQIVLFLGAVTMIVIGGTVPNAGLVSFTGYLVLLFGEWITYNGT